MSLVVSNTSPLTNLAAIGQFHLLESVFGRILIAEAVWQELYAGGQVWPGASEVAASAWIERESPTNRDLVQALRLDLDAGEAESIALALQRKAELILLDERDGRHRAQRLGLKPLGVLGVLLLAKRRRLLAQVEPSLTALRERAGFYLSDDLHMRVLQAASED
jgi:uncharacterized protein